MSIPDRNNGFDEPFLYYLPLAMAYCYGTGEVVRRKDDWRDGTLALDLPLSAAS